jgi:hypothetical protein
MSRVNLDTVLLLRHCWTGEIYTDSKGKACAGNIVQDVIPNLYEKLERETFEKKAVLEWFGEFWERACINLLGVVSLITIPSPGQRWRLELHFG